MSNAPSNIAEFSVSELSFALKRTVERDFAQVRVRGELSGVKRAASGHWYMSLKDDKAALDGIVWRGQAAGMSFRPEDGLEVIATGKLTTYPGRSKYQIVIDRLEPAGAGALMALLEERKRRLADEGLFDPQRKRALPFLPNIIGVVTSPTGSVIRDILHRLSDRFPTHTLVWPVLVQGEGAADQIANAIDGFNRLAPDGPVPRPDVLIVARGGGSIEDLWSFNEESVVRAAAASEIPLISAVGHETDTTLIDHAADRRAPTPTAAAEIAVPVRSELMAQIADSSARLDQAKRRMLDHRHERLAGLARALPRPEELTGPHRQRLDDMGERLPRGLGALVRIKQAELGRRSAGLSLASLRRLKSQRAESLKVQSDRMARAAMALIPGRRERLAALGRLLQNLDHQAALKRGFALIWDDAGRLISQTQQLTPGKAIKLQVADGQRSATVAGKSPPNKPKARAPKTDQAQGSLL